MTRSAHPIRCHPAGAVRRPRTLGWVVAVVFLTLVAAACGDDAAVTTTVATATTTTAAATTTTAGGGTTTTGAPVGLGPVISIGDTLLGPVLVDPDGLTLYLRRDDLPTESKCTGGCVSTWPPLTGEIGVGEGVDGTLLSTLTRPDGLVQLTYSGQPLYRYAGDSAPGQTNGQGLGGIWFMIQPNGDAVRG